MEENICANVNANSLLESGNLPCDSGREASAVIGLGGVDCVEAGSIGMILNRTLIDD